MLTLPGLDETAVGAAAAHIAALLPAPPLCIHLDGDLGAGKTTFVRALLRALGYAGRVKSPTYGLLEVYEIGERRVLHCDLYRLEDPEELEYLGLRDHLDDHLLLIEWPQRGGAATPAADLVVTLAGGSDPCLRSLSIAAPSERGDRLLNSIKSVL